MVIDRKKLGHYKAQYKVNSKKRFTENLPVWGNKQNCCYEWVLVTQADWFHNTNFRISFFWPCSTNK